MNNATKIEDLIARTADPVQQAMLLVLANFDRALDANTVATQAIANDLHDHREEFNGFRNTVDSHIRNDARMLASIRGGWWVGIVLLSAIQLLGAFIISRMILSNDMQDARLATLEEKVTTLITRQAEMFRWRDQFQGTKP